MSELSRDRASLTIEPTLPYQLWWSTTFLCNANRLFQSTSMTDLLSQPHPLCPLFYRIVQEYLGLRHHLSVKHLRPQCELYSLYNCSSFPFSDLPLCGQPSPPVAPHKPLPEHPDDLGKCIKTGCGKHKSKLDCNENFGCAWCYKNATDGSLLKHPRCKKDWNCYDGELGRPNPFLLPFKPKKTPLYVKLFRLLGLEFTLKTLVIVGASVAVGLLVLILFVCCLCKRKKKWSLDLDEMFGDTGRFYSRCLSVRPSVRPHD